MYYMGFSYKECYHLPVQYRAWFLRRLGEEIRKSNEGQGGQTRGAHDNTPDARAMMERSRSQVPAKLRRFT